MEILRQQKKSNRVRAESNSEPLPLTLSLLVDLRHILDKVMDNHAYHYNLLEKACKHETLCIKFEYSGPQTPQRNG